MASPEKTFSLSGVQASIFLNSGEQGDFRSIRLQRSTFR